MTVGRDTAIDTAMLLERDRRLERLLADAEAACGPVAWPRVEVFLSAVVELYAVALERLLSHGRSAARDPKELDLALVTDEVVSSVLLVHDLHPETLDDRVRRALDLVRRESPHTSPLTIAGVAEGILQLEPLDEAAPLPTTAAVARAVEQAAPDLAGVEIRRTRDASSSLLSVDRLVRRGGPT